MSGLLLLIGSILIVALIVSLIFGAFTGLESESYKTAKKSKDSLEGMVSITDISSTYAGRYIKNITMTAKLGPSAGTVSLENMGISLKSPYGTSTLSYAGNDSVNVHAADGFYTLGEESYGTSNLPYTVPDDFNADKHAETLHMIDGMLYLNVSGAGDVRLGNCSGGAFVERLDSTSFVENVDGVCDGSTLTRVNITPAYIGKGRYSVEYVKRDVHHEEGRLQSGDIVRIRFEMRHRLGLSDEVTVTTIPKYGTPTIQMFVTPDMPGIGYVSLTHY